MPAVTYTPFCAASGNADSGKANSTRPRSALNTPFTGSGRAFFTSSRVNTSSDSPCASNPRIAVPGTPTTERFAEKKRLPSIAT